MSGQTIVAPKNHLLQFRESDATGEICHHCGVAGASISSQSRLFCCKGCAQVYRILHEQRLLSFYDMATDRPQSLRDVPVSDFSYTNGDWFRRTFTVSAGKGFYAMRLKLPAIHCAACVWLLEKLPEMLPGITGARINYLRKELSITASEAVSTAKLIQFIADLGYTPDFKPQSGHQRTLTFYDQGLLKRMAVAAFGFGNAMLFSLPEYFSERLEGNFRITFLALNIALSCIILFYSAGDFFVKAFQALRFKRIIIDLPISLGITAMFARSIVEITQGASSGYFDTFAGLIFFLLLGRYVQSRSFSWLAFERDNLLFLPLAVRVRKGEEEIVTPVQQLLPGDRIRLLNGEIAPARCKVISANASTDYSFITGESLPIHLQRNDILQTGGKVMGSSVEAEILECVDPEKINRIWESAGEKASESSSLNDEGSFSERILPYFAFAVVAAATGGLLYWLPIDAAKGWNAFTAVLVITCPCALAMAKPFSFFTTQNVLGRAGLFLKNSAIVEKFFTIRRIVFDKTGTITSAENYAVEFHGPDLSESERIAVGSLAGQSSHPLSQAIHTYLGKFSPIAFSEFEELPGKGICTIFNGEPLLLGSAAFLKEHGLSPEITKNTQSATAVYSSLGLKILGTFFIRNATRANLDQTFSHLSRSFHLALLSGDSDRERERFENIFPPRTPMHFHASPEQKADIIANLNRSAPTMMIGDGLNDAGALKQAHVGIAVSEHQAKFSPACDAILSASAFSRLPQLINQARQAKMTTIAAYAISFGYNIFGISVALSGNLTPLFCAILMPLSSLSVIAFTFSSAHIAARFRGLT